MSTTVIKGRPRRRGAVLALSLVTAAVMILGTATASAVPGRGPGGNAGNPIDACRALVDGTAGNTRGAGVDGVAKASRTCAIACGTVSGEPGLRGRLAKATVDDARLACAAACDFIILEGASQITKSGQPLSGPVATAVTACQMLKASSTTDAAGLPLIDNGGRSWR